MLKTYRATVDEDGNVHLLEPVELTKACQVLVTVLDDEPAKVDLRKTILFSGGLEDWERPEEEEAWAYLQEPEP